MYPDRYRECDKRSEDAKNHRCQRSGRSFAGWQTSAPIPVS